MTAPRAVPAAVLAAWFAVTVVAMPWHLAEEHHGGEELCGHACEDRREREQAEPAGEPAHHVAQHAVDFLRAPSAVCALAPLAAAPVAPEPEPAAYAPARDLPAPASKPRLRCAAPRAPPSA